MARTRDLEKQKRNEVIYAEWLRGASLTDLGARYGLARQVVGRIVKDQYPEGDDDDDRALFRGYMWRLYDEVQEIGDKPGWKMNPNGGTATGADGEPAEDVQVKVQAKELQLKIIRELRLLDARDRPAQQNVRHTVEFYERQKDDSLAALKAKREAELAELEELRRAASRAPVIPGEVVRELPPAGGEDQQRGGEGC